MSENLNTDASLPDLGEPGTGLAYLRELTYRLSDPCPVPPEVQRKMLEGMQALIRRREAHETQAKLQNKACCGDGGAGWAGGPDRPRWVLNSRAFCHHYR